MQQTNNRYISSTQDFFVASVIGLCSGASIFLFIQTLNAVEAWHKQIRADYEPVYLIGMPFVIGLLYLFKKKSLYFPTQISELTNWRQDSCIHWSPWMSVFQFFGTSLSHLVGASVGREGAAVLIVSGLIRNLKLRWSYWGPISMAIGFSSVIGNWWIGLIFLLELYSTNLRQKILTTLGSACSILFMNQLSVPHLFNKISQHVEPTFFQTFYFILILGICSGWIMRIYKSYYFRMKRYFKTKSIYLKMVLTILLVLVLWHPMMWPHHSLGLISIQSGFLDSKLFSDVVLKLVITLFSVSLGFWGGEFIPLVYAGVFFGNVLANLMGFNLILGVTFATYLLFAGATRLKWTSLFLTISLLGFSWIFWIYFLISLSVSFSGEKSIYQMNES